MTTAIALLRISPDGSSRDMDRLGLETQRADIEAYAAANGIQVLEWHSEVVSGGAAFDDRPGLLAALEAIARTKATHLLVQKRDRLAREPLVSMMTERMLEKIGAKVTAAQGNNEETPEAELVRAILDAAARYERKIIGIRTKAALAVLKASGKRLGRPPGIVEKGPRRRKALHSVATN